MAIRLPQNQINIEYTSGGIYLVKSTYKDYIGPYYKLGSKAFAGDKFDPEAPLLIAKENNLVTNPQTALYSALSGIKSIENTNFSSDTLIPLPLSPEGRGTHFFAKQLRTNPIRIFRISEEDYQKNINKNTLYAFTEIEYDQEWGYTITEKNLKDIPEINIFLEEFSLNTE